MVDLEKLGWRAETVGELDHRLLKAPHVKLRSATAGKAGDVAYCVDLRITKPNEECMSMTELHSLEHFLLAGFRRYLPESFLSVGIMGCQTGFYLVLLNEGDAERIFEAYGKILTDILKADEVPYAKVSECGNFRNHSLPLAKKAARRVLDARADWSRIV